MVRKVPFVALLFFCTAVNMADIGQVRFDENVYIYKNLQDSHATSRGEKTRSSRVPTPRAPATPSGGDRGHRVGPGGPRDPRDPKSTVLVTPALLPSPDRATVNPTQFWRHRPCSLNRTERR